MRPNFTTWLERAGCRGLRAGASGLLLAVAVGGLLAEGAAAQYDVPLVFVDFDPGDYGLARATDVRRGRVSLAWHWDGVRLNPYYLRSDPVPPRVTYPDAPDEESGIYMEATLDGRRAGMLDQILGLVDDIAIMDYRTEPLGANGALAHSYHELELAKAVGVDVFVGVETVPHVDEDLHTFFGPFDKGLPPHSDARWIVLEERADGRGRLWLIDGAAQLAEVLERSADAVSLRYWPAGRPIRVGADAQSFHNLGPDAMRSVTDEIIRYLSVEPAFAGLAFHDYYGLRELLGRREGDVRD